MSVTPATPTVSNESIEDRLYTVKYRDAGESHLGITDEEICEHVCETKDCARVCPASVWEVDEATGIPHIAYENCLECSSCRYACPHENVIWTYPDTGAGVSYKYG